jgi:tetratricopeptide (TPR) repeat protein
MKPVCLKLAAGILAAGVLLGQPKQPQIKSQKEAEAWMAIQNAPDPDARIAAVENLLTKFADTELKVLALQIATQSARQKNDYEKTIIYAERTLEADPKNFDAMLALAGVLAQRTREFDLDREEKLGRAEKLVNDAMNIVKTAEKPGPHVTDEQWEAYKKDNLAQGYEILGLAAMVRKKYDVAINNFKQALEVGPQPDQATMLRLANAYTLGGKPDEAIAVLDKLLAMTDIHPQIKQAAQAERARAVAAKSGGTAKQ